MRFGLRDPQLSDSDVLLEWRNRDAVRAASLTDDKVTQGAHEVWFAGVMAAEVKTLQLMEVDDEPVGVVRLEGLDLSQQTAGWGCHLGVERVPPGTGAVLPLLGLALGFGRFDLRRMHADVLASNKNMRGMHRRLGLNQEGVRRSAVRRADGSHVDVFEYGVLREEWPELRRLAARLLPASIGGALEDATVSLGASPLDG